MKNKPFLVDMHVHTSESSACGQIPAEEVVRLYNQAGYDAIVITDHFSEEALSLYRLPSWEERVAHFMTGYRLAQAAAQGTNLKVFFGIEFRNRETEDDFLVYGLDEAFLLANPDLFDLPLVQDIERFHEAGAAVVQAHPLRVRLALSIGDRLFTGFPQKEMLSQMKHHPQTEVIAWSERKSLLSQPQRPVFLQVCQLREPEHLDGIEAYNGNCNWCQNPDEINAVLKAHPHLLYTSASDFHEMAHLAKGGTYFQNPLSDTKDLVRAMRAGEISGIMTSNQVEVNR